MGIATRTGLMETRLREIVDKPQGDQEPLVTWCRNVLRWNPQAARVTELWAGNGTRWYVSSMIRLAAIVLDVSLAAPTWLRRVGSR